MKKIFALIASLMLLGAANATTSTYSGSGLNSISGGNFVKTEGHATFTIEGVSYNSSRLDYSQQSKNKTQTAHMSWSVDNGYDIKVTNYSINMRGYQATISSLLRSATAQFSDGTTTGTSVDCKTNSTGTGGAKTVSISNNNGLHSPLTLTTITGGNNATYTITNVSVTYDVTPINYHITYVTEAGATHSNPATYTIEQSVDLADVSLNGYTFEGWYDNQEYTGDPVTSIAQGTTGDKTFYAKLTRSQATIPTSYTWNIESTIHVGDVINEAVRSNSPAATTYEIVSFVPAADEVANANTFVSNTFTANRAGVATIKVSQPATTGFYAGEETKVVTIEKRTPEFSLNIAEPYYFDTDIENVLNLTAGDANLVSFSTSDASIAEVIDGTLHIYDVEGTVTITVTHAANYMWVEQSHDYEFTPENAPLLEINSAAKYNEFVYNTQGTCAYEDGIQLGDRVGGGFNWDDKYVDVHFDGTPDKLSFSTVTTSNSATGVDFRVYESADGSNWSQIWNSSSKSANVSDLQLQPSTRYLRFLWSGNFAGTFANVTVTEQQIAPIEVAAGALNVANSTYYSMFCHAETVVLIDATAYTASFEDDALVLTECEDGIIPANTVVMVAGAEDHYSYLPYDGTVAPVDNNAFQLHDYTDALNHRDYVLAEKDGVVAFHRYIADDETAEIAGKKVLVWEGDVNQAPAMLRIITEGQTATSLEPVYMDNKQYQNNQIYTIMGLPVSDMSAPGIYILNGQKYIVR